MTTPTDPRLSAVTVALCDQGSVDPAHGDRLARIALAAADAIAQPPAVPGGPWRIGQHYNIHVYEGERPVATFHHQEDANRAVAAVNRDVGVLIRRIAELEEALRCANALLSGGNHAD